MKIKRKQQNKNQNEKIKNLISFNNIKNPFKNSKESEQFFKNIMEEEMNLSNNYNSENLNRLLNLYFKGLNLYQNTPNTDKVDAFIEKSQLLLQSSQAKKVLTQNKTKTPEVNEIKTDSTLIDENEESDHSNKNKVLNKDFQNKNDNEEDEDDDDDDENNNENKLKFDYRKYKTIKHNEIQNRNKLNYLSNTIKKGIKEKNNQKIKINEINKEYSKIKEQQLKTSIFLEDEIKKQSNNFQVKLLRKRTMFNKSKNIKLKIDTIQEEENIKEEINKEEKSVQNIDNNEKNKGTIINKKNKIIHSRTPKKTKNCTIFKKLDDIKIIKRNSFSYFIQNDKSIVNKYKNNLNNNNNNKINIANVNSNKKDIDEKNNSVIDTLKQKIDKYLEEYNNDICKYYFLSTINKISDLAKKKYLNNLNISEGYQINIKNLLRKQISCNDPEEEKILEDDINSLKEELDHETQKNNDLYDKFIDEEISKFKSFGYSHSALKDLDILKSKIKCDIYNEIYNVLKK